MVIWHGFVGLKLDWIFCWTVRKNYPFSYIPLSVKLLDASQGLVGYLENSMVRPVSITSI